MAHDVVMPRLGWTMEFGTVVEWLKQDGDEVAAGEAVFAVEADKGITEVEALDAGVLRIPGDTPLGVEVPVGTRLAFIAVPGEPVPELATEPVATYATTGASDQASPAAAPATIHDGASTNGRPRISPRARRRARELNVDWTQLVGSGGTGRIIERDVLAAVAQPTVPRPRAAPAVRKLAGENGIDLGSVAASGPAGRITRADVRLAAAPSPQVQAAEPMGQVRRIVSQRMAEAARTVAPVTLTTEADASDLTAFRARLKEELAETGEPVPSPTDLIVRLTALALLEHPELNASLDGEAIVRHEGVHIGVAVDTDRGLVVPVIENAHLKSIHAIATESTALIEAARQGAIDTRHLARGTFTVSNLGMFEIDAFTPIVNLPECAILGVGRIVARPVVIDEETETIAVRRMMALSLTFDHRVVDGGPAGRFLQRCKRMIERPFVALTR